jgi:DNA-binding response OmpR family regulator
MTPNMDGLELCRRVRSTDQEGYTYFVFVTALEDRDHVIQGIEGGADEYLTKPLDRAELQARLRSAARLNSVHRTASGVFARRGHARGRRSAGDPLAVIAAAHIRAPPSSPHCVRRTGQQWTRTPGARRPCA